MAASRERQGAYVESLGDEWVEPQKSFGRNAVAATQLEQPRALPPSASSDTSSPGGLRCAIGCELIQFCVSVVCTVAVFIILSSLAPAKMRFLLSTIDQPELSYELLAKPEAGVLQLTNGNGEYILGLTLNSYYPIEQYFKYYARGFVGSTPVSMIQSIFAMKFAANVIHTLANALVWVCPPARATSFNVEVQRGGPGLSSSTLLAIFRPLERAMLFLSVYPFAVVFSATVIPLRFDDLSQIRSAAEQYHNNGYMIRVANTHALTVGCAAGAISIVVTTLRLLLTLSFYFRLDPASATALRVRSAQAALFALVGAGCCVTPFVLLPVLLAIDSGVTIVDLASAFTLGATQYRHLDFHLMPSLALWVGLEGLINGALQLVQGVATFIALRRRGRTQHREVLERRNSSSTSTSADHSTASELVVVGMAVTNPRHEGPEQEY